jgi:GNAT superfamily N-acetyltransferase
MNPYRIKQMQAGDNLQEALELVWKVFLQFEAPEYCEEGISEFHDFIQEESVRQKLLNDELFLWASYEGDRIVGVIAVRPPFHISLLFVDPQFHRRGIARSLFETVLEIGKSDGYREITVNSSPYAEKIYRRLGFANTDSEQTVNGIRFFPMKYIIK